MSVKINGKPKGLWDGFPPASQTKAVRFDLHKLTQKRISYAELRRRWGVEEIDKLRAWAFRTDPKDAHA